MILIKSKEIY